MVKGQSSNDGTDLESLCESETSDIYDKLLSHSFNKYRQTIQNVINKYSTVTNTCIIDLKTLTVVSGRLNTVPSTLVDVNNEQVQLFNSLEKLALKERSNHIASESDCSEDLESESGEDISISLSHEDDDEYGEVETHAKTKKKRLVPLLQKLPESEVPSISEDRGGYVTSKDKKLRCRNSSVLCKPSLSCTVQVARVSLPPGANRVKLDPNNEPVSHASCYENCSLLNDIQKQESLEPKKEKQTWAGQNNVSAQISVSRKRRITPIFCETEPHIEKQEKQTLAGRENVSAQISVSRKRRIKPIFCETESHVEKQEKQTWVSKENASAQISVSRKSRIKPIFCETEPHVEKQEKQTWAGKENASAQISVSRKRRITPIFCATEPHVKRENHDKEQTTGLESQHDETVSRCETGHSKSLVNGNVSVPRSTDLRMQDRSKVITHDILSMRCDSQVTKNDHVKHLRFGAPLKQSTQVMSPGNTYNGSYLTKWKKIIERDVFQVKKFADEKLDACTNASLNQDLQSTLAQPDSKLPVVEKQFCVMQFQHTTVSNNGHVSKMHKYGLSSSHLDKKEAMKQGSSTTAKSNQDDSTKKVKLEQCSVQLYHCSVISSNRERSPDVSKMHQNKFGFSTGILQKKDLQETSVKQDKMVNELDQPVCAVKMHSSFASNPGHSPNVRKNGLNSSPLHKPTDLSFVGQCAITASFNQDQLQDFVAKEDSPCIKNKLSAARWNSSTVPNAEYSPDVSRKHKNGLNSNSLLQRDGAQIKREHSKRNTVCGQAINQLSQSKEGKIPWDTILSIQDVEVPVLTNKQSKSQHSTVPNIEFSPASIKKRKDGLISNTLLQQDNVQIKSQHSKSKTVFNEDSNQFSQKNMDDIILCDTILLMQDNDVLTNKQCNTSPVDEVRTRAKRKSTRTAKKDDMHETSAVVKKQPNANVLPRRANSVLSAHLNNSTLANSRDSQVLPEIRKRRKSWKIVNKSPVNGSNSPIIAPRDKTNWLRITKKY